MQHHDYMYVHDALDALTIPIIYVQLYTYIGIRGPSVAVEHNKRSDW